MIGIIAGCSENRKKRRGKGDEQEIGERRLEKEGKGEG